jgi:hypothetical protein
VFIPDRTIMILNLSRLDSFLVSSNWDAHFPNLNQRLLQRPLSDHFSILLDCNEGGKAGK